MILIGTKSTEKNYTRLDLSYLSTPNIYYSISAYNNGNGSLIGTCDEIILAPPGGPSQPICSVKCNALTYAWELTYIDHPTSFDRTLLGDAVDYYDVAQGIVIPFWQAISAYNYNQFPANHPYRFSTATASGLEYLYKHKEITADMVAINGAFHDKNGNAVTDGFLIEKKMDQYSYMDGSTTVADPGINICSDPTNYWMNFHNGYVDVSTYTQVNDYQWFTPTLPSTLQCSGYINYTQYDQSNFLGWDIAIGDWMDCVYYDLEGDTNDVFILAIDCFDDFAIPGGIPNGVPFTGFEFEQINQTRNSPGNNVSVKFYSDGSYNKLSQVGKIGTGLYNVYVYTSTGKILSSVYEIPDKTAIKRHKDYVKLEIAPNRIENNVLKFKISSEIDLPVTISAHTLNGQIIHTENTTLSKVLDLQKEIEVGNGSTPYNQIRVTLTFEDGSTIQQTALK